MYNIQKLNKISPKIKEVFSSKYSLKDDCDNPDGILVRSFNMADYEIKENLVAIARAGAGVNNIPVEKMAQEGIVVFNTPGANANAVKELAICALFLASRDIIGGNKWVNTLSENVAKTAEKGKSNFAGYEIMGKTLGVIGLGAIGGAVANSALALGMKVIGYDPCLSDALKAKLNSEVKITDLATVIKESDYITLHVPLLDSTKNMINETVINEMKDGVVIINMARGALVNVDNLKDGINKGKIAKYVVDFPEESVLNTENVIVIPHLGASTEEAEDNCAIMASKSLVEYLENGNIINSVNYPNLIKERIDGKVRTCILFNANDVEKIETLVGDKKVAVRKEYGYAIIDSDNYVKVDNVIKVRNI